VDEGGIRGGKKKRRAGRRRELNNTRWRKRDKKRRGEGREGMGRRIKEEKTRVVFFSFFLFFSYRASSCCSGWAMVAWRR
jgi:hypothetical protein